MQKQRLPALDVSMCVNHSPHVVILGAGATKACVPDGDANGMRAPVMLDLIELVSLEDTLTDAGFDWQGRDFEAVYDELSRTRAGERLVAEIDSRIWNYFAAFELPRSPTVYDYLLLSMREKDLIATFNWDPLLVKAYLRNLSIRRLPRLVFLHGSVAIGVCRDCRVKGLRGDRCRSCTQDLDDVRLLYPIRNKDYTSDPFIQSEWQELRESLEHAYFLTIFGYSAPATDAAAIALM